MSRTAVIAFVLPALLFAGALRLRAEGPAATPTAMLHLRDGSTADGEVAQITPDAFTLRRDGQDTSVSRNEIIAVEFAAPAPDPPTESWLLFSNGDRAPLAPVDLVDDQLGCRWPSATGRPQWHIPVEFVTALLRQPLVNFDSPLLAELSSRTFADDTLILQDGSRITGALEAAGAESFRMETAVGPVIIEAMRVAAIAMNSALIQRPPSPDEFSVLTLRDGAWLTLHDVQMSNDGVTGQTSFRSEFRAPLADLATISFFGPATADLTLREPAHVAAIPFVSRAPRLQVNRNVRGGWLALGGRTLPRGFGMTSGMAATFALAAEDREFLATIGLDDAVGDAGSVVFTVDVDDRRLFTSPVLTGRDAPLQVGPLDVAGGRRLTLSVEFGEFGHVQDVADWCDPILLR